MRHGEAVSNIDAMCSCWPEKFKNPLTPFGKETVREVAEKFLSSGAKIDFIFNSPLLRGRQTAVIVGKVFRVKPKIDKRLREIGFGEYNGKHLVGMWKKFKTEEERITKGPIKGETYVEILDRITSVVKDLEKKYKGKNIMIVSHEGPLFLLQGWVEGLSIKETIKVFPIEKRIHKAEIRDLDKGKSLVYITKIERQYAV